VASGYSAYVVLGSFTTRATKVLKILGGLVKRTLVSATVQCHMHVVRVVVLLKAYRSVQRCHVSVFVDGSRQRRLKAARAAVGTRD